MIKGIAYINREFKYKIHATDRTHKALGTVVVDADVEEFNSRVTIYNGGTVVIESPFRRVVYNLKDGALKCE